MRWVSERSEIYGKLEWKNYTFANQIKGIHEGRLHEIKGVEEEEKQWREKAKQSFNFYFLGIGARNYLSISMVLLSQLSVIFPLLCSFSFFPFSLFFLSFFFFLNLDCGDVRVGHHCPQYVPTKWSHCPRLGQPYPISHDVPWPFLGRTCPIPFPVLHSF